MEVDAFLADSAESVQGKIYALGVGWNAIFAPAFPIVQPRISLGITVRVPYTATNQMHSITVHLDSEDGVRKQLGLNAGPDGEPTPIMEIAGNFNLGRPPLLPAGDEQIVGFAMQIDQLQFDGPGMFTWEIEIDGAVLKRLPMRIVQMLPGQLG